MAYVDLHSHVLAGIDDGAPDGATSLAMLRGLAAIGFDTVYATPHQRAGMFLPTSEAIAAAYRAADEARAAAGLSLTLGLGAENMWDAVLHERLGAGTVPSYGGGPAFLVEVPVADVLPAGLAQRFFELGLAGRLPVLAHPERYPPHFDDVDAVAALGRSAALVVDLGAVAGYHGKPQGKLARRLLEEGVAHAVASDAHSTADVRAAAEGIAWIEKRLGKDAVRRLLDEHPRRIVAGELPA